MTPIAGERLRIATISDVHLGHNKVPTEHILTNLRRAFPDTLQTHDLDLIFIAGDLFDQILTVPEYQVMEIKRWIVDLLLMCHRHAIKLRVLNGTPSHDRGQGRLFTDIAAILKSDADVKYIDTLSIEYIPDYDIHVLYVPDEWRPDPDDTWADVQTALNEAKLDRVDYAVMHGLFEHQIPNVPATIKIPTHKSSRYLSIVKKYITIGHHHVMSVNDRILAQGSFDRLCHGEEGAKGHFRIHVRSRTHCNNDDVIFVENTGAAIFATLSLLDKSEEETLRILDRVLNYPAGSHIRLVVDKNAPNMGVVDSFRKRYRGFHWTIKATKQDEKRIGVVNFKNTYQSISIRPDGVADVIKKRLEDKNTDRDLLNRSLKILETYT